jgi:hypothetical protein
MKNMIKQNNENGSQSLSTFSSPSQPKSKKKGGDIAFIPHMHLISNNTKKKKRNFDLPTTLQVATRLTPKKRKTTK